MRGECKLISADLVRCISISCHAITPDHAEIDPHGAHEVCSRPIHNNSVRHAILLKLPSCQACSLQARSRLVDIDVHMLTRLVGRDGDP